MSDDAKRISLRHNENVPLHRDEVCDAMGCKKNIQIVLYILPYLSFSVLLEIFFPVIEKILFA